MADREPFGALLRYDDAEYLRPATRAELAKSVAQAESDGGAGVITVEIGGVEVSCYCDGDPSLLD